MKTRPHALVSEKAKEGFVTEHQLVETYYGKDFVIRSSNTEGDMFCVFTFIIVDFPNGLESVSGTIKTALIFASHDLIDLYFYEIVEGETLNVVDAGAERLISSGGVNLDVEKFLDGGYLDRNYWSAGVRKIMEEFVIGHDTCILKEHIEKQRNILSAYVKS